MVNDQFFGLYNHKMNQNHLRAFPKLALGQENVGNWGFREHFTKRSN